MIFNSAIHYKELPQSHVRLKELMNYNPVHSKYTARQKIPERNPKETDRAGWRGYDRVYSKFLVELENKEMNFLEIGIMHGYGMLAWQRFFKQSTVYGIDFAPNGTMLFEFENIKAKYPIFNKTRKLFFDTTKSEGWLNLYGKKFDVIIDDGGHHPYTQIDTFKNAWEKLKYGGIYFIEDVSHRYGDFELQTLSDFLTERQFEFESIEIYYHENVGLQKLYMNADFIKRNKIKNRENIREYIVAIRKKSE